MLRSLILTVTLVMGAQAATAQAPNNWTQVGMLDVQA